MAGKKQKNIHIGTSGWNYDHWIGEYYPDAIDKKKMLETYIKEFQTVEVNNTFYQLPDKKKITTWLETVPDNFIFSVKASRYITHMKKLKDPEESTGKFFKGIKEFGEKIGPVLFQLPGHWNANEERLKNFLKALPDGYRYAFEFRDQSWLNDDIYEILSEQGAAFCIYHFEDVFTAREITADFVYVRLHGPNGAYKGKYEKKMLKDLAGDFRKWADDGKDVFCYFDNDENGYAAQNAAELQELLS